MFGMAYARGPTYELQYQIDYITSAYYLIDNMLMLYYRVELFLKEVVNCYLPNHTTTICLGYFFILICSKIHT